MCPRPPHTLIHFKLKNTNSAPRQHYGPAVSKRDWDQIDQQQNYSCLLIGHVTIAIDRSGSHVTHPRVVNYRWSLLSAINAVCYRNRSLLFSREIANLFSIELLCGFLSWSTGNLPFSIKLHHNTSRLNSEIFPLQFRGIIVRGGTENRCCWLILKISSRVRTGFWGTFTWDYLTMNDIFMQLHTSDTRISLTY